MMGKLSAGLERFVGDLLQPRVNWRDVMNGSLSSRGTKIVHGQDLTEGSCHKVCITDISGEALGEIVFAIDCSGSIGEEELHSLPVR